MAPVARPAAKTASAARRSRPRTFDLDEALDQAVRVFSERGYHGASIAELTEAMRLSQASLYKVFRDKQAIFLAAFDRYRSQRLALLRAALGEGGTGMERLRRLMAFYVESSHGAQGRLGCLLVGSMGELATFDPPVAQHITSALGRNEALFADLLRQGQKDGSIPAHIDAQGTARMLLCLTQGMRVVGKTDSSRADMRAVVDAALRALA